MISFILFCAVIFALGFGLPWFFARVDRRIIRCHCGAQVTRDAAIVDPVDVDRIAAQLSELCPICRTRAQSRAHTSRAHTSRAHTSRARKEADVAPPPPAGNPQAPHPLSASSAVTSSFNPQSTESPA